jgi:hypothetical protein
MLREFGLQIIPEHGDVTDIGVGRCSKPRSVITDDVVESDDPTFSDERPIHPVISLYTKE